VFKNCLLWYTVDNSQNCPCSLWVHSHTIILELVIRVIPFSQNTIELGRLPFVWKITAKDLFWGERKRLFFVWGVLNLCLIPRRMVWAERTEIGRILVNRLLCLGSGWSPILQLWGMFLATSWFQWQCQISFLPFPFSFCMSFSRHLIW